MQWGLQGLVALLHSGTGALLGHGLEDGGHLPSSSPISPGDVGCMELGYVQALVTTRSLGQGLTRGGVHVVAVRLHPLQFYPGLEQLPDLLNIHPLACCQSAKDPQRRATPLVGLVCEPVTPPTPKTLLPGG